MMGIAFLVACRCNSCFFFYNVCTFAFGEINILLLLLTNVRSLTNKMDDFEAVVRLNNPDVSLTLDAG